MYVYGREFDPTFVPGKFEQNVLRGIIVGSVEHGFDGGTDWAGMTEVCNGWAARNISTGRVFNRLFEAGWVWEHEWAEGDFSMGISREAEEWCQAHLGFPTDLYGDNCQIVLLEIEPLFQRRRIRGPGKTFTAGVKTTSAYVTKTRYTPEEAEMEKQRVIMDVEGGLIKMASARAYLAHITRRIAA